MGYPVYDKYRTEIEKDCESIEAAFLKRKERPTSTEAANHYMFFDGKGIHSNFNTVCFANCTAPLIETLILYVNQHEVSPQKRKLLAYFNWVIKKSPWRHAFFNQKDVASQLKNGFYMNTEKNSRYVVAAMCAMRHGWEFENFLDSFYFFKRKKFSPEFSFILSNMFNKDGHVSCPNTNHATFEYNSLQKEMVTNFKNCYMSFIGNDVPMNKNARVYRGTFTLFKTGESPFFSTAFKEFQVQRKAGWDSYSKYDFNNPEFIEALKEWDK